MSTGIEKGIHYITTGSDQITHLINVSYEVTNALRPITTKQSTSNQAEFGAGIATHTMTAQAYFAEDAAVGFNELQVLCAAGTTSALVFTTGVTGDVNWTNTGFVASVGQTSPNIDGSGTVDITFQLTGVVTQGTE